MSRRQQRATAVAALAASSMFVTYGAANAATDAPTAAHAVSATSSANGPTTGGSAAQIGSDRAITPIHGKTGRTGYTVDSSSRVALDRLGAEMQKYRSAGTANVPGQAGPSPSTAPFGGWDWWRIGACVGGLLVFVGTTVFPSARVAKLAVRIGKMVNKYGAKKVAKILTRTYKGKDINAERMIRDLAAQATGIASLQPCFK